MNKKYAFIVSICLVLSIVSGIIAKDLIIGGTILLSGLLCAYFASEGKRINYIFGLINYILMGYVSLKNNLYGIFLFYIFIFAPLQVRGFITWKRNLNEDNNVKVREFNFRNSIIITLSCVISSFFIGFFVKFNSKSEISFDGCCF